MERPRFREGGELVMAAPIFLCDTSGMSRDRWLEYRAHGPKGDIDYTIGGSDVSAVFGENPWTTPLELWRFKKGLMTPDDGANADQKEMGHLMEPIVAHWYGKKTGHTITPDTGLYQHADYPYALANLDYRFEEPGGIKGILECKTTNWRKADDWADGAIPPYYEHQVRFYMAVMDLDYADIACLWGIFPESDMVIRRVVRDRTREALMFDRLDAFIESLRTDQPPDMSGVRPAQAMQALAKIYGESESSLPTIEFSAKQERPLRRIAELQAQNSELERQIKANDKEATALSVKIAELMKEHERGALETAADTLVVDYVTKITRRPDSALLKKDYAAVYAAVLKASASRKLKVTIRAK
jgi:putative phage-type endonuclease